MIIFRLPRQQFHMLKFWKMLSSRCWLRKELHWIFMSLVIMSNRMTKSAKDSSQVITFKHSPIYRHIIRIMIAIWHRLSVSISSQWQSIRGASKILMHCRRELLSLFLMIPVIFREHCCCYTMWVSFNSVIPLIHWRLCAISVKIRNNWRFAN